MRSTTSTNLRRRLRSTGCCRSSAWRRRFETSYCLTSTRWANDGRRGDVTIAQEHFASNVIRGRLAGLARGWGSGHGPTAILACPPEELHDLALMIFGIVLNRHGWRIQYLGADTPADELLHSVGRSRPDLVVVAATTTDRFDAVRSELAELAKVAPLAARRKGRDDTRCRWRWRPCADRRPSHGRAEREPPSVSPARAGRRPVVLWFRRDLRLSDHPALAEAAQQGPITALFVLDDALLRTAGKPRLAYLLRTLRALEQDLRAQGGALTVRASAAQSTRFPRLSRRRTRPRFTSPPTSRPMAPHTINASHRRSARCRSWRPARPTRSLPRNS